MPSNNLSKVVSKQENIVDVLLNSSTSNVALLFVVVVNDDDDDDDDDSDVDEINRPSFSMRITTILVTLINTTGFRVFEVG